MPRYLERPIIFNFLMVILVSKTLHAGPPGELRLSLPISLLFSQNEVKATFLDLGMGLSADWQVLKYNNWFLGPGLSILATLPAANGNKMVSIRPYSVLGELRFLAGYDLFGTVQGLTPYLAIGSQMGSLIVVKEVGRQKVVTSHLIYGGIASAGVIYWIQEFGLGLGYGVIIGNRATRHKIELSVGFAFSPFSN